MIEKLFTDHPRSVGETYLEHMATAASFAAALFAATLACIIHAVLPFLFTTTGSSMIARLYERMITHRWRQRETPPPEARYMNFEI